jgi:DNA-directed RNA polymerase specialized sigma24 family protein
MFKFEDKEEVVNNEIKKRKAKWFLKSITHIDFSDVEQILRAHIYKKWSMWDQSKPLEPWLNRVISNQIKNLIRNNYGIFAKPCVNCPFNESETIEGNGCSFTQSGEQSSECPLYKKWAKGKRQEFNIKMATSFDVHDFEIHSESNNNHNIELAAKRMHEKMKLRLNEKQFLAYKLLYIDNVSDEYVAKALGYKTSEKNRVAGYRQIKNLKNMFLELAKKIINEEDMFYGH